MKVEKEYIYGWGTTYFLLCMLPTNEKEEKVKLIRSDEIQFSFLMLSH